MDKTPCIRYAQGVLRGDYENLEVFTGLVEAMVSKQQRVKEGKGMQNSTYPPDYDEFLHIVSIHSPKAYRFLSQHLPARTERNYR